MKTDAPMSDPVDTVTEKVVSLFAEIVGERANRLRGDRMAVHAMDAIEAAMTSEESRDSRAACGFTGEYVWENWPESDPPDWERPGRNDV